MERKEMKMSNLIEKTVTFSEIVEHQLVKYKGIVIEKFLGVDKNKNCVDFYLLRMIDPPKGALKFWHVPCQMIEDVDLNEIVTAEFHGYEITFYTKQTFGERDTSNDKSDVLYSGLVSELCGGDLYTLYNNPHLSNPRNVYGGIELMEQFRMLSNLPYYTIKRKV